MDNLLPQYRRNLLQKVLMKDLEQVRASTSAAQIDGSYQNLVVRVCHTAMAVRNELALEYVLDAISQIKEDKNLYRHEVKKYAKEARALVNKYTNLVNKFAYTIELLDFLDDISDKFRDNLKNEETMFYYAIKQELDYKKVDNSHFFTQIEMTSVLLDTNIRIFEEEKKSEFLLRDSLRDLNYLSMEQMAVAWKRLCSAIYKERFKWTVDLNSDRCKKCYRNLVYKMRDYKYILSLITKDNEEENEGSNSGKSAKD